VRQLEVRRHAHRDGDADRLSARGRSAAEDLGRATAGTRYDVVFVSPAARAAETAAWFLRGAGAALPDHQVIPGLGGADATGGSPEGMAAGFRHLLDLVPDGGRGLAFGHTPLIERGVAGLVGDGIEPLRELEGVLLTRDDGGIAVRELRLAS
jgi:phosphohistidine phosphatase SixA